MRGAWSLAAGALLCHGRETVAGAAAATLRAMRGQPVTPLELLSAFKRRNVGSWNRPRLVAALLLLALIPVALELPSLAIVAALVCALVAYEATVYAEARARLRHAAP